MEGCTISSTHCMQSGHQGAFPVTELMKHLKAVTEDGVEASVPSSGLGLETV